MLEGRRLAILNPSNIRLARLKKNFDQERLAKALGFSESTFGAIERGKRLVKKDVAVSIASKLGQPLQKLFASKGKKFVALIPKSSI